MPANLTPDYLAAEARFKSATDVADKIEALEEMLAIIPKHKGTDHLRGDLRRKMSQLREEQREAPKKGPVKRVNPGYVPKQGAGQVVLLGVSNVGKSALLKALTRAEPEVAPYPYTTRKPLPGMMMFEDVPIQLIDAPAFEAAVYEPWMNTLVRTADLALVVLDPASPGSLDAIDDIQELASRGRAKFVPAWWALRDEQGAAEAGPEPADLSGQELDDDALLARLDPGDTELPVIVLCNKLELGDNRAEFAVMAELLGDAWPLLPVSAETGEGLEAVRAAAFRALRVIRVYAKPPGKPASTKAPILMPAGSTVSTMARLIHKELEENLKFARIWSSRHFDGQRIPRHQILEDKDIVELNT